MTDSRFAAAKRVFLAVRRLAPAEWRSAVDRECGGDPALAAEVFELLSADAALPELAPASDLADPIVGREVSGYRIVARLGGGAMGVVYAAEEQQQPRRRVALKLLRMAMATPALVRRFHTESGALARLSHPHIAEVYASGTLPLLGSDVPFIAMELVPGALGITRYAASRRLPLAARLELLGKVCDAVHHGHQKGVIHRDLKPDNILVDEQGTPKLIDFGVARILDTETLLQTLQTAPGQLVGTLQYMCPEQCGSATGDLDVRGDVYSLGVVLYELIAGRPPIDLGGDGLATATQRIREELPPPPSRHAPGIRQALDVVTMTALAKRRDDRYPSAAALAEDLRRVVSRQPIRAQPPGTWMRAVAWVGRHPLWTTAAACAVMVVVALASIWIVARHFALVPAHLRIDADRHVVRLEARSGIELHSWYSLAPVRDAQLVARGDGSSAVAALIAYAGGVDADPGSGHLRCFPTAPPTDVPSWSTAVELQPFQQVLSRVPTLFVEMETFLTGDLMPAVGGIETLVVQTLRPGDYTGIRVFDCDGRLRYAAWHVGALHSAAPVAGSGRVVLAGLCSRHTWQALGQPLEEWPSVVIALELADGHRGPVTGLVDGRQVADSSVAWYRWLGPPELLAGADSLRLHVGPTLGRFGGRHVSVSLELREAARRSVLLTIVVGEDGNEVQRYEHDAFARRRAAGLGSLARTRLLDLAELPRPQ